MWKQRDVKEADGALDSSGLSAESIDAIRKAKDDGADAVFTAPAARAIEAPVKK